MSRFLNYFVFLKDMCCCKYIEETIISPMLYLLALGEKAQSIWLETLRVFLSFSVGVPAAFCSFSVGGKSYDYFPSLDVKKPGCRLRASHLFSQGTCPECSGSAPPPCVSLPGWRLPSLCRVQSLRMPLGGGMVSGHQLQGGNAGVWGTWQPVWGSAGKCLIWFLVVSDPG